ncbi:MAG: hypothetical protein B6D41_13470 [Chloroflexi bacterium UTCFX4]|jgi:catechol 2,3-dioxygenase-like lactoylglutathione lyase family enzyme|nr:MAG: hypothetical protein B6D41_13470 [Chloroflexi bacterium UTCFX4]
MSQKTSTTIPCLPCESLDATVDFWQAMGFRVTYKQQSPNPYAAAHFGDFDIHFFGLKQLSPHDNFSTCLVIVTEVEQLHQKFTERLRTHLGRVPGQGFPRISRMRPGQTRFTLTDVAGNSVIFIKRGAEDEQAAEEYKKAGLSSIQRAVAVATRLRDFKNDDAAAARALDNALAREKDTTSADYARALAARIDLAVASDDTPRANQLYAQFQTMRLTKTQRCNLHREFPLLDTLN